MSGPEKGEQKEVIRLANRSTMTLLPNFDRWLGEEI